MPNATQRVCHVLEATVSRPSTIQAQMDTISEPLLKHRNSFTRIRRRKFAIGCFTAVAVCALVLGAGYHQLSWEGQHAWRSAASKQVTARATTLTYPVWWWAPFWAHSGYGMEAINYVMPLLHTGRARAEDVWIAHSGDLIDPDFIKSMDTNVRQSLKLQELRPLTVRKSPGGELHRPPIVVCHIFPTHYLRLHDERRFNDNKGFPCPSPELVGQIAYRVGLAVFETETLPRELADMFNSMDEVWVPTEFHRGSFAAGGVVPDKLRVIRQGIDTAVFDPKLFTPPALDALPGVEQATGQDHSPTAKNFVFLTITNWEIVLEAYLREFRSPEAVELHIASDPQGTVGSDILDRVQAAVKRFTGWSPAQMRLGPRVFVHTQQVAEGQRQRVYLGSNAVVLPALGGGWARPQLEAMALGLPVIATNWSTSGNFMNEAVAYPLRIDGMVPTGRDGFYQGQSWARPSLSHLQQLIRHVFAHPDDARVKGAAARAHVQQQYSSDTVAELLMQELARVDDRLQQAAAASVPALRAPAL